MSLIKVSWVKNGSAIALFEDMVPQIKEGFSWNTTDFINGDFSVTILTASLNLQGLYECTVSYNSSLPLSTSVTFNILGMSVSTSSHVHFNYSLEVKMKLKAQQLRPFLHSTFLLVSTLAPPSLFVPQQWVALEREAQIECRASDFYPPGISFLWTRNGQEIQPPYQVEGEPTLDGYYTAVSNLTFYPSREDQNATFGCKVAHNGSYQELNFHLNITCE